MSKELKILKTTINIGIEKPFKLLHVTDTHLTGNHPRRASFDTDYEGCIEDYCFQALAYAKKNNMPILHTGAPEEWLSKYPEDRRLQQTPDAATLRAIDYMKSEPLIKALIVGHTHVNFKDMLTDTLPQYTTHGTFAGFVREIEVV